VRGLGELDARIISISTVRRNRGCLVAGEVLTLLLFLNMKDELGMQNGSEGAYLDKFQSLGLGRTFKVPAVAPSGIIIKSDRGPPLGKLTVTFLELRCG
jgi:hypothetical protein